MSDNERNRRQWRKPTPALVACCTLVLLIALRNQWPSSSSSGSIGEHWIENKTVVSIIIDGDTIEVADGRRVRLLGVDAPEAGFDGRRPERWSKESTDWLSSQIKNKEVTLQIGDPEKDRYGRTLAWVYSPDNEFINAELLRSGMAKLLPDFGLPQSLEPLLRQAEAEARVSHRGMWSKD